jgi:hypothetical protein
MAKLSIEKLSKDSGMKNITKAELTELFVEVLGQTPNSELTKPAMRALILFATESNIDFKNIFEGSPSAPATPVDLVATVKLPEVEISEADSKKVGNGLGVAATSLLNNTNWLEPHIEMVQPLEVRTVLKSLNGQMKEFLTKNTGKEANKRKPYVSKNYPKVIGLLRANIDTIAAKAGKIENEAVATGVRAIQEAMSTAAESILEFK